jgi:hypothetical protein
LRRNPSLRDETVKKRVEDLLNELEKLLRRTP